MSMLAVRSPPLVHGLRGGVSHRDGITLRAALLFVVCIVKPPSIQRLERLTTIPRVIVTTPSAIFIVSASVLEKPTVSHADEETGKVSI